MSGICIVQAIYLCALVTLMDTLVGILMGSWRIWGRSNDFVRKNVIRFLYE